MFTIPPEVRYSSLATPASYTIRTSNFYSVFGGLDAADTTLGSFTATLPISPNVGNWTVIADSVGSWNVNSLTIAGNGQLIMGAYSDIICDLANAVVTLIFVGGSIGWNLYISHLSSGGGSQTPWTSDINGGGFSLDNVANLTAGSGYTSLQTDGTVSFANGLSKIQVTGNTDTGAFVTGYVNGDISRGATMLLGLFDYGPLGNASLGGIRLSTDATDSGAGCRTIQFCRADDPRFSLFYDAGLDAMGLSNPNAPVWVFSHDGTMGIGTGFVLPAYTLDLYDESDTGYDIGNSQSGHWKIDNAGNITAASYNYVDTYGVYWDSYPPTTLADAIDRLAKVISNNGITPIPT